MLCDVAREAEIIMQEAGKQTTASTYLSKTKSTLDFRGM